MNKNKMEIHSLALWFIIAGTLKQNLELLCKQNECSFSLNIEGTMLWPNARIQKRKISTMYDWCCWK
jgi:hypothetical protein